MNHIGYDWKRFYENDNISDHPIVELTTLELGELPTNPFSNFKINPSLFMLVVEKDAGF